MAKKAQTIEQLQKENEELKKKLAELESLINNDEDEEDEELQEIENPYTVTNRAITELVSPKDTMFYLSGSQISLILTAYEFARLPDDTLRTLSISLLPLPPLLTR